MPTKYDDKDNIDDIDLGDGQWDLAVDPNGTRTYTANTDGATVTIKFRPPRGDQIHPPLKTGSTVTRYSDGSVVVKGKT